MVWSISSVSEMLKYVAFQLYLFGLCDNVNKRVCSIAQWIYKDQMHLEICLKATRQQRRFVIVFAALNTEIGYVISMMRRACHFNFVSYVLRYNVVHIRLRHCTVE